MSRYCYLLLPAILLTSSLSFAQNEKKKLFSSESEAGLIINRGNTVSQSVSLKTLNKYTLFKKNKFSARGEYYQTQGQADGVSEVTSENSLIQGQFERLLLDKIGSFIIGTWSKDNFRGFEQRIELGVGGSYYFLKKDDFKFFTEQGYTYRQETAYLRGPDSGPETEDNFWRSYFESTRKFSETLSGRLWVESMLNVEDKDDIEVKIEPSLDIILSGNFSLGLAYRISYDNKPPASVPARKRVDTLYTTSLKVKF